jgi:hypothetical protein
MEDKIPGLTDKTQADQDSDENIVRIIQRNDFEL